MCASTVFTLTKVQRHGDFLHGIAFGQRLQDLALASGERGKSRHRLIGLGAGAKIFDHLRQHARAQIAAAPLHWLNSIPNALICEFVAEEETNLREKITRQKLRAKDGYLEIPQAPGLGIDLDEDALKQFRTA